LRGWEEGFRALKAPVEGPEPGVDRPLRGFKAHSLGEGGWNRPSKQEKEENQNPLYHIYDLYQESSFVEKRFEVYTP
jgi:hypothetical protein